MLEGAGIKCMLNELSSTVVFERPTEDAFIRKWQLACEGAACCRCFDRLSGRPLQGKALALHFHGKCDLLSVGEDCGLEEPVCSGDKC